MERPYGEAEDEVQYVDVPHWRTRLQQFSCFVASKYYTLLHDSLLKSMPAPCWELTRTLNIYHAHVCTSGG